MKKDTEFGYKTRQILNEGLDRLDGKIAQRLHESRQAALANQRQSVGILRLAVLGHALDFKYGQSRPSALFGFRGVGR